MSDNMSVSRIIIFSERKHSKRELVFIAEKRRQWLRCCKSNISRCFSFKFTQRVTKSYIKSNHD